MCSLSSPGGSKESDWVYTGAMVINSFFQVAMVLFAACPLIDAQPVAKSCTNAGINGTYGYSIRGQIIGIGGFAAMGRFTADGNGNLKGSDSTSTSGRILARTVTGTYSVNSDCTGTAVITDQFGDVAHFNTLTLLQSIQLTQTDSMTVISGNAMPQRTSCTTQDLNGAYLLDFNGTVLNANQVVQAAEESLTLVADGMGGLHGSGTASKAGVVQSGMSAAQYTLAANCTGTIAFSNGKQNMNFILVNDGRTMELIETDAGTTVAGTGNRQFDPAGVISQVASGGAWKTTIILINLKASANEVRVNFWADDGTALTLPFTVTVLGQVVAGNGSSVDQTIAPGATMVIETEAPNSPTLVGWAEVFSSGPVGGSAVFRSRSQAGTDSEGSAGLNISDALDILLPYDNTAGFTTGAAFVNLSPTNAAAINVIIRDNGGNQLGATQVLNLPGNGHTSFALATQYPTTANQRGTIELQDTSGGGVVGLGLRFNVFGSFSSIPLIVRD